MAVRFDASGDYLSRTASLPATTAFTVCGWANRSVDTGTYATIFALQEGTGSNYILLATDSDGDTLQLWRPSEGSGTTLTTLSTGSWLFWAVVGSGSGANQLTGYYAAIGAALASVSKNGASFTPNTLKIGNDNFDELFNGRIAAVKVWDAALTQAELEQERWFYTPQRTANIHLWWPLLSHSDVADYSGTGRNATVGGTLATEDGVPIAWRRGQSRIWIPVSASGGGIEGQASLTQDPQTLSSSGTVSISGAASITQAAQTVSATGTIPISGEAALQQADQGISAVGAMPIAGEANLTQGAQSVSAAGIMPLSGVGDIVQSAQTASGLGDVAVSGEAAINQSPHSLSATGAVAISGEAALSQDANTISASSGDNQGFLDIAQDAQTVSATGEVAISGNADITQAGQTITAAGLMPISGDADLAQSAQAIISSGAVGNSGTANISQAGQTMSAAGVIAIQGSANIAQAAQTVIATGFITRLVDAPHTSIHIRSSAFTIVGGFGSGSGPGMGQSGFLQGVGLYQ